MPTPKFPIHSLKVVLVAASILALGAGVFAGMAVSHMPVRTSATIPALDRGSVAEELQLSASQKDQMRGIWEGVRGNVRATLEQAQAIQRDRDAAVVALLSDSQKARYAALTQQASEQFAALSSKRESAFQTGVDQTRKILSDAQRQTYDRIIQDRMGAAPTATLASTPGNVSVLPSTQPMGN